MVCCALPRVIAALYTVELEEGEYESSLDAKPTLTVTSIGTILPSLMYV